MNLKLIENNIVAVHNFYINHITIKIYVKTEQHIRNVYLLQKLQLISSLKNNITNNFLAYII